MEPTALLNWHDSARFSAIDGAPTKPIKGGWARVNSIGGHEDFPRIDPAIICLVHDGHDRAVLARQTNWPERLFSLLAGAAVAFLLQLKANQLLGEWELPANTPILGRIPRLQDV